MSEARAHKLSANEQSATSSHSADSSNTKIEDSYIEFRRRLKAAGKKVTGLMPGEGFDIFQQFYECERATDAQPEQEGNKFCWTPSDQAALRSFISSSAQIQAVLKQPPRAAKLRFENLWGVF